MKIRTATPEDAAAIAEIYAPVVRDTAISFELQAPDEAEMRTRIVNTLKTLPWLVGVDEAGAVCGYVYASRYRERAAYQWAAEVTAYVRADYRGRGAARQLYTRLFAILTDLGYHQVVGGIALPNAASQALHEGMGMTPVARFRSVGFKLGAWHDVGYWQLALRDEPPAGAPRAYVAAD